MARNYEESKAVSVMSAEKPNGAWSATIGGIAAKE
jgi:hypothetical protein